MVINSSLVSVVLYEESDLHQLAIQLSTQAATELATPSASQSAT